MVVYFKSLIERWFLKQLYDSFVVVTLVLGLSVITNVFYYVNRYLIKFTMFTTDCVNVFFLL